MPYNEDAARRMCAERIITGEYKAVVVAALGEDDKVLYWNTGGCIAGFGLVEVLKREIGAHWDNTEPDFHDTDDSEE